MIDQSFDVAIIGGGAAGSAAALSLLQAGMESVCIVERSNFSEQRIGETIPPDANDLLHKLGVQKAFAAQQHLPCYGSHSLWGDRQLGHNDFLVSPYGHGWHLDRASFDKMLLDQATSRGATLIAGDCTSIDVKGDRVSRVKVEGDSTEGSRIEANWFIDATGRGGLLTRACGANRLFDDSLTVIWTRFRVADRLLGNATWLEAAPYGWWYGAELPGGEAIIALGTDPHVAKSQGFYDLRAWVAALLDTDLIAPQIASAQIIPGSFRVTSSHSYITDKIAGANWIGVGDAVSAFDPLSSAGIYKALSTGLRAADTIAHQGATSVGAYQKYVKDTYREYLGVKADLYAAEGRWTDLPFWQKKSQLKTG
ncbi:MAG: tryptophan 7-halogenase [Sneathiella sp.]